MLGWICDWCGIGTALVNNESKSELPGGWLQLNRFPAGDSRWQRQDLCTRCRAQLEELETHIHNAKG